MLKYNINFKSYVINLERRKDRLEAFKKNSENVKSINIERFEAVDGNNLKSTEQLCRIFDGNDYQMRSGMVGVTLSHMLLYIELLNRKDYNDSDGYLIFEDDIQFTDDFDNKLYHLHLQMMKVDWDIVYLGHHYFYPVQEMYDDAMPKMEKWNKETSLSKSMGGIAGYFISKKGARNLMEFINTKGMTNGIDTMQQKAANDLNVYYILPHLFYSECYRGLKLIDSDIQYNFTSLSMPLKTRLQNEIKFYKDKEINIEHIDDYNKVCEIISKKEYFNPFFYVLKQVKEKDHLEKSITYPYYYLDSKIIFIFPKKVLDRYFDRLKKNDVFNLDDAIMYQ